MWIKASDRKPDTVRKVFVRGMHPKLMREGIATAAWHDFDDRWNNFMALNLDETAISFEPEYWCEITDILSLPIEGEPKQERKIDVPEITQEEHDSWYVSLQNRELLKITGYNVRHPSINEYWPISPNGGTITIFACREDAEAWHWCWLDYNRNQPNEEGLK